MLILFFIIYIFTKSNPVFKGDVDYFNEFNISPKELRKYMNIFDEHPKNEYNKDHSKKNVIFDNDVFDALFGVEEFREMPVHVPTDEEIRDEEDR
ncbi:hypothetical protein M153_2049000284, partial [Pseudoloma neurophilia]